MRRFTLLCTLFFCWQIVLTSCTPKTTQNLLQSANVMGVVLAEKTAQVAGKNPIVIISPDASWGPMSSAEIAFRDALKKQGVPVLATKSASLGDPMKSGAVGLQPGDLFEVLGQYPNVGAIVSFANVPLLDSNDAARLATNHPPILVVATASLGTVPGVPLNQKMAADMIDANWVQVAVIDGTGNISADLVKDKATRESFDQHFEMLQSK